MSARRSLAITRASARLLASDPGPIIATIAMPLLLTAFLLPATRAQLRDAGFRSASGAEQLVPGMAILFAFLSTSMICMLFYREHAWGTWDRLRSSPASSVEVIVGKVIPLYLCLLAQMGVLFAAGALLFGYRPNGSWPAIGVVIAAFVATLVMFGVMLFAALSTLDQAMALGNLGGMVMAGLGGALTPASTLPGWARAIGHATPAYWTLQSLHDITLNHAGLSDLGPTLGVLAAFTVGFGLIAAWRFRPTDDKVGTT